MISFATPTDRSPPAAAVSREAFETLVWLEPDLRDAGGHFLDVARAMRNAAASRGLEVVVVGNREAPTRLADLAVVPALDRLSEQHVPRWAGGYLLDPVVASRRIRAQLREQVGHLCSARTLVVASSVNHRHYAALASWVEDVEATDAPALAVMLRASEFDGARGRRHATAVLTRIGLHALERAAEHRSVRLFTDSDELAAEYARLTSLPVAVVPTPYLVPDSIAAPATREAGALRLGFFGQARVEKGFPELTSAIERLSADGGLDGLAFTVQCYVRPGYQGQARHDASRALAVAARVLPEMLDSERYFAELASCDAVLLPYAPNRYHSRTSGVFVDALATGLPVVTTAGTWMARQLERHGAGIVYAGRTGDALASAIVELRARFPELRRDAIAAAPRWRSGRHPRDLLGAVVQLFE